MQLSVRWLYNNEILLSQYLTEYVNGTMFLFKCVWLTSRRAVMPGGHRGGCRFARFASLRPRRPTGAIVNLTTIKAIVIKSKNYLNFIHHQKPFSTIRWEFPLWVRQLFRFIDCHVLGNWFLILINEGQGHTIEYRKRSYLLIDLPNWWTSY